MTFSRNVLAVCALLAIAGGGVPAPAKAASVDRAFAAAVAKVLAGVHNDYLDSLTPAQMRAFVACAQKVMNQAPTARKRYVLAASNTSEMRRRFDEVSLENRAQLKKQVSSDCVQ